MVGGGEGETAEGRKGGGQTDRKRRGPTYRREGDSKRGIFPGGRELHDSHREVVHAHLDGRSVGVAEERMRERGMATACAMEPKRAMAKSLSNMATFWFVAGLDILFFFPVCATSRDPAIQ